MWGGGGGGGGKEGLWGKECPSKTRISDNARGKVGAFMFFGQISVRSNSAIAIHTL